MDMVFGVICSRDDVSVADGYLENAAEYRRGTK